MKRRSACAALLIVLAMSAGSTRRATANEPTFEPKQVQTLTQTGPLSAHRVVDVDGDGLDDILTVSRDGAVRVFRGAEGRFADKPAGALVLPDPARSLLALADLVGEGRPQLVVLSPAGVAVHSVGDDGAFQRGGRVVAPRTSIAVRLGAPRFAPFVRDVNRDGRPDLIVPRGEACDLWVNEVRTGADGKTRPRFRRTATVRIHVRRFRAIRAEVLSDVLEETFRIPELLFEDVNGDGRDDLVVFDDGGRAFHLQREDGSLPVEPDSRVDLSIFRDTTPDARVRPGRTLAGQREARLQSSDLDLDGIPDYVIAHRRKVWIFHGGPEGPQFTDPTSVLRTAEDVTALVLAPLDDDGRPDLLLVRVGVPEVSTILRGLFAAWDVDVSAVGYGNVDGRSFDQKPRWRGDLVVRLPGIVGALRDLDGLISRFEEVQRSFRPWIAADLDGDGVEDLALVGEDEVSIDLWRGRPGQREGEATDIGSLVFGEGDKVWSLDRILDWVGDAGRRRVVAMTGGREADGGFALRPAQAHRRSDVQSARNGDRALLVVVYDATDGGPGQIDVYTVR